MVYDGPIIQREDGFYEWQDRLAEPMPDGLEMLELTYACGGPLRVARWVEALRNARCRTISRLRLRQAEFLYDVEREGDEWSRVRTYGVLHGAASNLRMHELAGLAQLGCEVLVDEG